MQKDTVVNTIGSVMLDPTGGNHPGVIRNITDVIVVQSDGTQTALGLGGYLDIGLLDTMEDLSSLYRCVHVLDYRLFLCAQPR